MQLVRWRPGEQPGLDRVLIDDLIRRLPVNEPGVVLEIMDALDEAGLDIDSPVHAVLERLAARLGSGDCAAVLYKWEWLFGMMYAVRAWKVSANGVRVRVRLRGREHTFVLNPPMRDPVCVKCGAALDKARAALGLDHCESCARDLPESPIHGLTQRHTVVAGVTHRRAAYVQARVESGDELRLVPEPTNDFDTNAVAVYKGEVQIGYLPRMVAAELLPVVKADRVSAMVSSVTSMSCHLVLSIRP